MFCRPAAAWSKENNKETARKTVSLFCGENDTNPRSKTKPSVTQVPLNHCDKLCKGYYLCPQMIS